jgi:toxin-antitoxin system PIN domain toxin
VSSSGDRRTALLDVNVLIALVDPRHVHHNLCHGWFADRGERPWATCAITQNAVLRILGHPRYPNSPGTPAVVSALLRQLVMHPEHQFWSTAPSLLDHLAVDTARLLDPGQITDAYLLAVAVHHRGVLATLDTRLNPLSVRNGPEALQVLAPDQLRQLRP